MGMENLTHNKYYQLSVHFASSYKDLRKNINMAIFIAIENLPLGCSKILQVKHRQIHHKIKDLMVSDVMERRGGTSVPTGIWSSSSFCLLGGGWC